jgi:NAD(P)-dependent dehydrogenase (short-subunit alcohol dehydrogenase family)
LKSFASKVAAITGAGSGMGRELALELARRGCDLALCDVNDLGLEQTVSAARSLGVKVTSAKVDVAERQAVFSWAEQVRHDHGRVNLVFNNAGVALSSTLEAVSQHDFEWIMGVNFWGVVYGTQAFLPHLKASGDGHVVNTSRLFGLIAFPGTGSYNASKFAVRGYTEALRMELDIMKVGVSATCVHPGGVRTEIARACRMNDSTSVLFGQDERTLRDRFDKLLSTTSAQQAALAILKGVARNRRRVVIGPDARVLHFFERLLGGLYQPIVTSAMRRLGRKRDALKLIRDQP